jgi:hypothetical protein
MVYWKWRVMHDVFLLITRNMNIEEVLFLSYADGIQVHPAIL